MNTEALDGNKKALLAIGNIFKQPGIEAGLSSSDYSALNFLSKFQGDGSSAPALTAVISRAYEDGNSESGQRLWDEMRTEKSSIYTLGAALQSHVDGQSYVAEHKYLTNYPLAAHEYRLYQRAAQLGFLMGATGKLDQLIDAEGAPTDQLQALVSDSEWACERHSVPSGVKISWTSNRDLTHPYKYIDAIFNTAAFNSVKNKFLLPVCYTDYSRFFNDFLHYCMKGEKPAPRQPGSILLIDKRGAEAAGPNRVWKVGYEPLPSF